MRREEKRKIIGAGSILLLLGSMIGTINTLAQKNNPHTFGILEYEPKFHDFGNMTEGETNITEFEIWTSGGCCELIFNLAWTCPWVNVFPINGITNGEHIPITVTVDTTGLDIGFYACDIQITTNGGGSGVFNVTLNVVSATHPLLAFSPQAYHFGFIPENVTMSTTFEIWNGGNDTLNYTLLPAAHWITVVPMSGSSIGEHDSITVIVNTQGLQNQTMYQSEVHIHSNGGSDVFVVTVVVGTKPAFEITGINGGLFRTTAIVTNNGTADAHNVNWRISFSGNGLILLGKESTGSISTLAVGEEKTISSNMIVGLGAVIMTVTIYNDETTPVAEKISAKLLLFVIKI